MAPTERAFLPAALEIVETPASPTLRVTSELIVLFLASASVWSYVGKVDIIAIAPGKVIIRGRTKVIQPSDAGVVRAVRVADGDAVEKGQVLIELDRTISTADKTRYTDQLAQARLDQARLKALLAPGAADLFAGVSAPDDLLAAARARLSTLTAPVAGVVQDLAVNTLGGVVTPAQQLGRIVPADGEVEVDAVVANQDVGFVEIGQEAEIKIDTFPFTRYGLIRGRVERIAHDAVDEPQSEHQRRQGSQAASDEPANIEHAPQLVYTARIALEEKGLVIDGKPLELAPGMAVVAEIKTGKRRVLDYPLSSLRRYGHDVLRER